MFINFRRCLDLILWYLNRQILGVKNIGNDNLSSERLKAKTNKINIEFLTGCWVLALFFVNFRSISILKSQNKNQNILINSQSYDLRETLYYDFIGIFISSIQGPLTTLLTVAASSDGRWQHEDVSHFFQHVYGADIRTRGDSDHVGDCCYYRGTGGILPETCLLWVTGVSPLQSPRTVWRKCKTILGRMFLFFYGVQLHLRVLHQFNCLLINFWAMFQFAWL